MLPYYASPPATPKPTGHAYLIGGISGPINVSSPPAHTATSAINTEAIVITILIVLAVFGLVAAEMMS